MILGADPLVDYASRGGLVGLLIIILYGGFKDKPWWVFGWVYRDLQERHRKQSQRQDQLLAIATHGTIAAEALAEKATGVESS